MNPNDNIGVRYVLPYLLLEQENVTGAKRALKPIADEEGLTAAATRAFVAFADGRRAMFRRELAMALFTLPALRCFLLNDWKALPPDELGYGTIQPDMETFGRFAWSTYCAWPGLREACKQFLAEPMVLKAEQELLTYWSRYWGEGRGSRNRRAGSWDRMARTSYPVCREDCVEEGLDLLELDRSRKSSAKDVAAETSSTRLKQTRSRHQELPKAAVGSMIIVRNWSDGQRMRGEH